MPDVKGSPQLLSLPVLRWEYRELYEKDESFNVVLRRGKPQVADSWVVISILAPDGTEVSVEVDREPFDKVIFPLIFYPTLLFWQNMSPSHRLYSRRDEALADLLELKRTLNV